MKGIFWGCLVALMGTALGFCGERGEVWIFEQDFVKFGKKEVYEKYKMEMLADFTAFSKQKKYSFLAIENVDEAQYVFLTPLKDLSRFQSYIQRSSDFRKAVGAKELPYFSTINFTVDSLQCYIEECSFVPKGRREILDYPALHFYLYGIVPGNAVLFEERMKEVAMQQSASDHPVCFRVWRTMIGADIPKYVVMVFGDSEKEASKLAEGLQLISGSLRNLLRSEKQGTALLRSDLSWVKGMPNSVRSDGKGLAQKI